MEIRHLRYFVAVAEALSFGEAARKLHMSQPPLSRRIADMEQELGVRVFERSTRQVELTEAGRALLPHAKAVLEDYESGLRAVLAFVPSNSQYLRIGLQVHTAPEVPVDIANRLLRENIQVDILQLHNAEQLRFLATGDLDVAVLRYPFDTKGLKVSTILAEPLGVVMRTDHSLCSRDVVTLSELQPYPLMIFPRSLAPDIHDEILGLCRARGYVPPKILFGENMAVALAMDVDTISFSTQIFSRNSSQSGAPLAWRPLEGDPLHTWTAVVCRSPEWDPVKRLAFSTIVDSLQRHDRKAPKQRPALKRAPRQHRKQTGT